MGLCCSSTSLFDGEAYINQIFSDSHFKLVNYDYNRLLNTIVTYRIDQEVHKQQIIEKIIPEFFDKHDMTNPYLKFHSALFEEILSNLDEKNNIYIVLLYFYPFINHDTEIVEDHLFETFNFIKNHITQSQLTELFEKYIKFISADLTFIVWSKEDNSHMKGILEELRKIHSEKNAISTADRILFPLIKELGINEEVNINLFRDCVKKYHIGDYQSVREAVFNEYSQK